MSVPGLGGEMRTNAMSDSMSRELRWKVDQTCVVARNSCHDVARTAASSHRVRRSRSVWASIAAATSAAAGSENRSCRTRNTVSRLPLILAWEIHSATTLDSTILFLQEDIGLGVRRDQSP